MIRYLVALIVNGQFKSALNLQDTNIEGLKRQIKKHYPDFDEDRLEGHGFHYITNASHYSAAGFDDECFVNGYTTLRAPAHFNAPFFCILRATRQD